MEGVVSVIVCCYNGSKHLDSCFSCLLNQNYSPLEILFVNDGSTDDSFEKSLRYTGLFIDKGDRLLCFSQEHKGVGAAASLALSHASGDFIMCYDVDDVLYPDAIMEMVSYLKSNPRIDLVRANGFKEDSKGNKSLFVTSDEEKRKTDLFEDILLGRTNNWAGSYMVRSTALWEVYPSHKIIESRYGQNLQILLPVSYGRKAGFIDKPLLEYRFNPVSFTNNGSDYVDKLDRLLGYKAIRLSLIDYLGIDYNHYSRLLDIEYLKMMLDMDLNHNELDSYVSHYESLMTLQCPNDIHSYHYYRIRGDYIACFYYRFKSFISRLSILR